MVPIPAGVCPADERDQEGVFARHLQQVARFFVICAVSFILYYRGVRYGKHSYSAGSQPVGPAA